MSQDLTLYILQYIFNYFLFLTNPKNSVQYHLELFNIQKLFRHLSLLVDIGSQNIVKVIKVFWSSIASTWRGRLLWASYQATYIWGIFKEKNVIKYHFLYNLLNTWKANGNFVDQSCFTMSSSSLRFDYK